MGSLVLRGRFWHYVYYDADGRKRSPSLKTTKKKEAERRAAEIDGKVFREKHGLSLHIQGVPFERVSPDYLKATRDRSAKHRESRFRLHIDPFFKGMTFQRVRPADISAFLQDKLDEGLSPQTVKHLRNHLSGLYTWATEQAQIFSGPNPAHLSKKIDLPEPEPKALTLAELELVIAAATDEARDFIRFAALTGMRRGELIAWEFGDIDEHDRFTRVRRSGDSSTTKTKRSRIVPIHQALVPHLERLRREARGKYVLPGRDGRSRRPAGYDASGPFRTALKRAGLVSGYQHVCRRKGCGYVEERETKVVHPCPRCGFSLWPKAIPLPLQFKDLRSTFLTLVAEETGETKAAQDLGGHSADRITRRHYLKANAERLRDSVNRVPFGEPTADTLRTSEGQTLPNSAQRGTDA